MADRHPGGGHAGETGISPELAQLYIALVEDDEELRALIAANLADLGLQVTPLHSAEELAVHLETSPCDVVILDVGLPGEDGLSVARRLAEESDIRIVMLTGRNGPEHVARGLLQGADLYLTKPVDEAVLVAGLESIARRMRGRTRRAPPVWALASDGWTLCAPDGATLALTRPERVVLRRLVAASGSPVPKDALIGDLTDRPWDFDPHRLEMLVHRLRTRVRTMLGRECPVRAVRGVGYLFDPAG
ncbi:response regulator transcription factor [Coralloluteibacterium thermophilus]|uniref:Response regulator transcription factor n=1 Tax=Coralloluteibacterium thermophilum TaxID=2707049 RepID=A0ABV9NPI8_9GAMM